MLRGARSTLERFRPVVFFELTPTAVEANGDSTDEIFDLLEGLGYSICDDEGRRQSDPRQRAARLANGVACNLLALPDTPATRAGSVG